MRQPWSHSVDLTTRYPYTEEGLCRQFEWLLRRLTRATQGPIRAFLALEQTAHGHLHAHALLGRTEALSTTAISRTWRAGFSRTRRLEGAEDAVRYATKWAPHNADTYRIFGRRALWAP